MFHTSMYRSSNDSNFMCFSFVSGNSEMASNYSLATNSAKKADVAEHPKVFHHVGLLINEPPSRAGLLFI